MTVVASTFSPPNCYSVHDRQSLLAPYVDSVFTNHVSALRKKLPTPSVASTDTSVAPSCMLYTLDSEYEGRRSLKTHSSMSSLSCASSTRRPNASPAVLQLLRSTQIPLPRFCKSRKKGRISRETNRERLKSRLDRVLESQSNAHTSATSNNNNDNNADPYGFLFEPPQPQGILDAQGQIPCPAPELKCPGLAAGSPASSAGSSPSFSDESDVESPFLFRCKGEASVVDDLSESVFFPVGSAPVAGTFPLQRRRLRVFTKKLVEEHPLANAEDAASSYSDLEKSFSSSSSSGSRSLADDSVSLPVNVVKPASVNAVEDAAASAGEKNQASKTKRSPMDRNASLQAKLSSFSSKIVRRVFGHSGKHSDSANATSKAKSSDANVNGNEDLVSAILCFQDGWVVEDCAPVSGHLFYPMEEWKENTEVQLRHPRLNSSFIRVMVLETQMRRVGKLSSQVQGRAKLILMPKPPFQPRCSPLRHNWSSPSSSSSGALN
ncbi:hypothetical protein SJAG_03074 [Schizosaccharomyces japonicus yFS275]|uniref:Uncharacterized protein n=1 Tax=Schizosaccharomyces japonicus (strain yFS275 / FY16936) TaxID=402676 RepID=B6K392_SCHJY|nr:hypothetical protein SJAG_03074 [Schizosaccharomyces japonicus yFS275]EEB07949.1 hypothetical protein SJAG_03074 [Schizosaccharomyces japonicus yFS275]